MRILAFFMLLVVTHAWASPIKVGQPAPDWMLTDMQGKTVALSRDTENGNAVVMVFWATWCSICHELLPQIDRLKQTNTSTRFYALNIWEDGDPIASLAKLKITMPAILKADNVAHRYNVKLTPGVFVVAPDATIKYIAGKDTNAGDIIKHVKSHLAKIANAKP